MRDWAHLAISVSRERYPQTYTSDLPTEESKDGLEALSADLLDGPISIVCYEISETRESGVRTVPKRRPFLAIAAVLALRAKFRFVSNDIVSDSYQMSTAYKSS